ncbi:hypothetical protein G7059_01805 [Erysipelothrix sp. HDW6A]|nr:hypothetical protein G7059_01805 [Erysipelothrix sp. HDW6A]
MRKHNITIDLPGTYEIVDRFGLGPNGMTQKFFSNELMRIADGYVPFRQGALKNSATIETDGTAINYNVPYARVHWYGKIMAGSLPKQPTEKDMNYQGAPIRGHRWVERAYADNKDAIIKAVESYMRNK